ncbi:unnamed protein product [Cylicocyclus nassatus]|uniref:Uncharacterized protein n=1 Tax=Cylicocyclus nassatus TaxID=53992 RepID=A0AA36M234_CYLNA|nr:unnamed protein product [Cylicocyclus nassatus]
MKEHAPDIANFNMNLFSVNFLLLSILITSGAKLVEQSQLASEVKPKIRILYEVNCKKDQSSCDRLCKALGFDFGKCHFIEKIRKTTCICVGIFSTRR